MKSTENIRGVNPTVAYLAKLKSLLSNMATSSSLAKVLCSVRQTHAHLDKKSKLKKSKKFDGYEKCPFCLTDWSDGKFRAKIIPVKHKKCFIRLMKKHKLKLTKFQKHRLRNCRSFRHNLLLVRCIVCKKKTKFYLEKPVLLQTSKEKVEPSAVNDLSKIIEKKKKKKKRKDVYAGLKVSAVVKFLKENAKMSDNSLIKLNLNKREHYYENKTKFVKKLKKFHSLKEEITSKSGTNDFQGSPEPIKQNNSNDVAMVDENSSSDFCIISSVSTTKPAKTELNDKKLSDSGEKIASKLGANDFQISPEPIKQNNSNYIAMVDENSTLDYSIITSVSSSKPAKPELNNKKFPDNHESSPAKNMTSNLNMKTIKCIDQSSCCTDNSSATNKLCSIKFQKSNQGSQNTMCNKINLIPQNQSKVKKKKSKKSKNQITRNMDYLNPVSKKSSLIVDELLNF